MPQSAMLNTGLAENGRTPAENRLYASVAAHGRTRQQKLESAARAREARRAKARAKVIEENGPLPDEEIERLVDAEIRAQMTRMQAAALTARRRKAAEEKRAAEIEAELDATGLEDAGEM